MLKPDLFIDSSNGRGRGVFTNRALKADTVIEMSPVIVMSAADRLLLDKTLLHDYIFEWGKMKDQCCMALCLVSMYNHSYKSNCEYIMDYEAETIAVQTVRNIKKGEELTINYNGDWNDPAKLWFDAD
ncbi:SET domain-containing protein-lysine N-methyltransferase [soil metagenome]